MKADIVHGLLFKLTGTLFEDDDFTENRKHFQTMARYKYDGYKQFSPGMRFIERLALWLDQFKSDDDRRAALKFVRDKLVYISGPEMELLVASCFPDLIKPILIDKIAEQKKIPNYKVNAIVSSTEFKSALRQSLFCGLSDGARTEIFRRTNPGVVSHEQVYQTYELSAKRADKMQEELVSDLKKQLNREVLENESKFNYLFLLDDFSASGTSYLKYDSKEQKLKGKINALYDSIFKKDELKNVFDLDNLEVHIVLYICTEQARDNIVGNFKKLADDYGLKIQPKLHIMHLIKHDHKITAVNSSDIVSLCEKDDYYDAKALEDKHTTGCVKLGFGNCALPVVLYHNCPNNSLSILWAYENASFGGLFPRIPRHKEI